MRTSARQREKDLSLGPKTVCRLCSDQLALLCGYVDKSPSILGNTNTISSSCIVKSGACSGAGSPSSAVASPAPNSSSPVRAHSAAETPTSRTPLPFGLDCWADDDCPSPARRRTVKYASPAPAPSPASPASHPVSARRSHERVQGKGAPESSDMAWIPYPGQQVFPLSPPPEQPENPPHAGPGGDACFSGRPPFLAATTNRILVIFVVSAAAALGLGLLLSLRAAQWTDPAPTWRRLPAPEDFAREEEAAALVANPRSPALPPAVLERLAAELTLMRRELQRLKTTRAMEASTAPQETCANQNDAKAEAAEAAPARGESDVPMPDFALESAGGAIVATPDTSTFHTGAWETLWGIPIRRVERSPRNVIQPSLEPGACWAFRGSEGRVVIALAIPARLTAVTLEHIPARAAISGRSSAPRDFAITGLERIQDTSGHLLGYFSYSLQGPEQQTFFFKEQTDIFFQAVLLHILNNHGNTEHTCVYRLRVHGFAENNVADGDT